MKKSASLYIELLMFLLAVFLLFTMMLPAINYKNLNKNISNNDIQPKNSVDESSKSQVRDYNNADNKDYYEEDYSYSYQQDISTGNKEKKSLIENIQELIYLCKLLKGNNNGEYTAYNTEYKKYKKNNRKYKHKKYKRNNRDNRDYLYTNRRYNTKSRIELKHSADNRRSKFKRRRNNHTFKFKKRMFKQYKYRNNGL